MERTFEESEFIEKHMNTLAYFGKSNQKVAALNLWANGYEILARATIFKDFDKFKGLQYDETTPPPIGEIMHFVDEKIMDDTRIVTCFENFMKGILILNDVVVHQMSKKNKSLKFEQMERPLRVSEVFSTTSFSQFDRTKPESWETNFQTVNFNWMLKPTYQAIINLPPDILAIITRINDEGNKLHFMMSRGFQMGKSIVEMYEKLFEFATSTIKKCIMDLNEHVNLIKTGLRDRE